MIELRDLCVRREGRPICTVEALAVSGGDRLLVQGANGSGKTTLLRVMAGLEQDYEGHCALADSSIRRVYVHQSPYMLRGTIFDNVAMGLQSNGRSEPDQRQTIADLVDQIGLASRLHMPATRLSGGEQRRVAIVRALAASPDLLLLDEPFADLDDAGGEAIRALLASRPEMTTVVAAPGDVDLAVGARIHRLGDI